jgi:hypothetical protein
MQTDELRIIEHTNTQVRFLAIMSQILKSVGNRSVPLSILRDTLKEWSVRQEHESAFYRNHNGILTNNGRETTAFSYYIELLINFGFLTRITEVVRTSKFGTLFNTFTEFFDSKSQLANFEKLFYLYFILYKDADNIIIIFQTIIDNQGIATNKELRERYEDYLKVRLKVKGTNAKPHSQFSIAEKLRKVQYIWQNAKEYSKHIIPPRIEWLIDLGLIEEIVISGKKSFKLKDLAINFYNSLDRIDDSNVKDITDSWLLDEFINKFHPLVARDTEALSFDRLNEDSKISHLNEILPIAYKALDSDGIRRISALPFYIFVMIISIINNGIILSFGSLKEKLLQSYSTRDFTFAFRDASRINESYFTISINHNI